MGLARLSRLAAGPKNSVLCPPPPLFFFYPGSAPACGCNIVCDCSLGLFALTKRPRCAATSSFVSIISEFSHRFGQALAQWRAFSLAVARSSRLHSFSRSGHLSRCCMVCSEVPHSQAVSAVSAYSPIYSCWFCCGPAPYPCGVCWGISTASTQIYGRC